MIPPSKKQIQKALLTLKGLNEQNKHDEKYYEQRPVAGSTLSRINIFQIAITELEKIQND